MEAFQINSIPLKDVIVSLANSFDVPFQHDCSEYFLKIPKHLGEGEIRGIDFNNGLGLITYHVNFSCKIRLEFTLNEIHPVKFINSLNGPLTHEFEGESIRHEINEYDCAIVASKNKNGHIIEFEKDILHTVVSIEIDRSVFAKNEKCELRHWKSKLKEVLIDENAEKEFYHISNCGTYFKDLFKKHDQKDGSVLTRKLLLQSTTLDLFVKQIVQYEDDLLNEKKRSILRIDELKRIEAAGVYIKENLKGDVSVKTLASVTGLNPGKLQFGFKYLFSQTVNEYVHNTRFQTALYLLQNPEFNIREVIGEIGLESGSYFSKIFKKRYGVTPKQYKQSIS